MELKEKLEKFVGLINVLNDADDIEFLYMALAASKFGKDVIFNESEKTITIEVPKYVYKEVEKIIPYTPPYYYKDTITSATTYNK